MIRCGELCRSCTRICHDPITPDQSVELECVICEGTGKGYGDDPCEECNGSGFFTLDKCPRKILGNQLTEEINTAGYAIKGHLPEDGGLLNQEAWFIDMWSTLNEDQARIENEIRERRMN